MIAHAGGWDEIVITVGAVLLFLVFRSTRSGRASAEPGEGPCLYCGRHLPPGAERCPECGFRARRGATSSASSEVR